MGDGESEDPAEVVDLINELEDLADAVDTAAEREQVEETIALARRLRTGAVFGRVIRGFGRGDAAEAFLGSLIFGIPMIIESGTLEIGEHIATRPVYLVGTLVLGVAVVYGVLYVAEIQHVEVVHRILGVIPRRFAGVVSIAFATSLVLMTIWGRVDWAEPIVAFSQVAVVFVGMGIGAALGDILPGS